MTFNLFSYGDLHAATIGEKWFSIFAMLTGIGLFFGFILGGMASMLTNLDSRRMRYTHHFDVIKDHMVCYVSQVYVGILDASRSDRLRVFFFSFSFSFFPITELHSFLKLSKRQIYPTRSRCAMRDCSYSVRFR